MLMTAEHEVLVPGTRLGHEREDELRRLLVEQRAGLLERLGVKRGGDPGAEADDSASDATLAHATDHLGEIDAALARVEDGTYGWCESCQDPIPLERLEVVPAAARCVHCQTRATSLLR
jgi:RNA polymerase-binding transcription factor DksA